MNKDHVPSKSLLTKPYPANLPVVQICAACNNGFSVDEEYLFLFLQCVLADSTDPACQTDSKIGRALQRHEKLRARIDHSRREYKTMRGKTRSIWKPELKRINRVILKNGRGHAFYEQGEPILAEREHVWSAPLEALTTAESSEFGLVQGKSVQPDGIEFAGWAEVGSRMMMRAITGQDLFGNWVIVQDDPVTDIV